MCIFCKIINQELPSKIIHENDDFLAFEDIDPKAPIHILVVPKKHTVDFASFVQDADMQSMSLFIKETAKKMDMQENGYRLITNIGEYGMQLVPHFHFHLVGGAQLKWSSLV